MTASQTLKRLVRPLIDPAVYDFWAQKLHPTLSWDRCLARVVERHVEARDTVSLTLKPNRLFSGFQPGQHLNVTVEVNGVRLTRSYSPSDAVSSDGRIRLTIRAIPQGKVSEHLVHHCRIGDVVELGSAYGDMTLPAESHAWLFVAAGSGITPIMSLLKTLTQQPLEQPVSLIYWAAHMDLCRRLKACWLATFRCSGPSPLAPLHLSRYQVPRLTFCSARATSASRFHPVCRYWKHWRPRASNRPTVAAWASATPAPARSSQAPPPTHATAIHSASRAPCACVSTAPPLI